MAAHQVTRLLDGLVTEPLAQLPDQLLACQLNLLCALGFDALGVNPGLLGQRAMSVFTGGTT
jgi:hypothetical protein